MPNRNSKILAIHLRKADQYRKHPVLKYSFLNDKPKYITLYLTNKEAQAEYQNRLYEYKNNGKIYAGDHLPEYGKNDVNLLEFIEIYLEHRQKKSSGPSPTLSIYTLQKDAEALRNLYQFLGDISIDRIDAFQVDQFINHLQHKPTQFGNVFSLTSINIFIRTLSSAYNWAIKHGYSQEKNPFSGKQIKIKSDKKSLPKYFLKHEITDIRNAGANKPPHHLQAFNFSLYTGIRAGEIVTLNINDLFNDILDNQKKWFMDIHGKGNKTREIPISMEALDILKIRAQILSNADLIRNEVYKHVQTKDYDKYIKRAEAGFVFYLFTRRDSVTQMYSRLTRGLNIDKTFHSARHFFGVNYLENGGHLKTLKEILGHSNIETTEIYAQITRKSISRNIDKYTGINIDQNLYVKKFGS